MGEGATEGGGVEVQDSRTPPLVDMEGHYSMLFKDYLAALVCCFTDLVVY